MSLDKSSWKTDMYNTAIDYTSHLIEKAVPFIHEFPSRFSKGSTDANIAALQKWSGETLVTSYTRQATGKLAESTQAQKSLSKESISESTKNRYLQEAFKSIQEKNSFLLGAPKDFSEVRTSDLLSHLRNFPDDAKYFLLSQNGQAVEDRGHSQEAVGQKMIVNFWSNSHANELLGLGDLLPNNVLSVEVNGKIGTLKASPRPGYYTDKWLYLSVYNESTIKILKIWNSKADFLKDLESQWQKRENKVRELEYEMLMRSNSKDVALLAHKRGDDARYQSASHEYEIDEKTAKDMEKKYKDQAKWMEGIMGRFWEYINNASKKYNVPSDVLAKIFLKESGWIPTAHAPRPSTAYWLGQITDQTWSHILTTSWNSNWQRSNPEHQILASAWLLRYLFDLKDCSNWGEAAVYYHVGSGTSVANLKWEKLARYVKGNPAVAKLMTEMSWAGYFEAAWKYYLS